MLEPYLHHVPRIAKSAWIHPSATLMGEVTLGEEVSIWPGVVLRGDQGAIEIGDQSNLQDLTVAHATGGVSRTVVGPRVTVGHRVLLHGCHVLGDSLIGMGSILLDNCVIEPGCILGAGTLIPEGRRIPSGSLVLGSPGRVVRTLTEADYARIRTGCETYRRLKEEYRR
jgi:carbonic anhydrase/acetyltransferase-like protein (isoleucine patch superfamily)